MTLPYSRTEERGDDKSGISRWMVIVQHPAGGMVGEPKTDKTDAEMSGERGRTHLISSHDSDTLAGCGASILDGLARGIM